MPAGTKGENLTSADHLNATERISRRGFLAAGGSAGFGLLVPGLAYGRRRRRRKQGHSHSHHKSESHLRRSSYESLVGERFQVAGGGSRLKLTAVKNLNKAQAGSEDAFALVFRGRRGGAPIKEAVPELYHPGLGRFRLLLTPGDAGRSGRPYVAVINRSRA